MIKKEQIFQIAERLKAALRSNRGRDIMLYLLFVAISFVFWMFMSLDAERQRDFDIPFELTDIPDSVVTISQPPREISVSVKAKDTQLLRFMWGKQAPIRYKWADYVKDENTFLIPHSKLDSKLRDYFGAAVQIVSFRPDSVRLDYTTGPGVKVKLLVQADVRSALQYIQSGAITANVDSVTLYSTTDLPHSLQAVSTEMIVKSELKDTARYEVKVKPIAGVRIIPDRVTVTIPVEPLILRKRMVQIDCINLPEGKTLVTFPSQIEVSYLVPMSAYSDDYPIKAFVDFYDTALPGDRIPVSLSAIPAIYRSVSQSTDNVEYIIENN